MFFDFGMPPKVAVSYALILKNTKKTRGHDHDPRARPGPNFFKVCCYGANMNDINLRHVRNEWCGQLLRDVVFRSGSDRG